MDITFEVEHHLFVLRLELINHPGSRLRNIETVALSGKAIDVVQQIVAVLDLNGLPHAHAHDTRLENAAVLVDRDGLSWDGRLRKVSFHPYEDIRQAAVDGRNDV